MNKVLLKYLLILITGIGLGIFIGTTQFGGKSDDIVIPDNTNRLEEAAEKMELLIEINKGLNERLHKSDTVIYQLRNSIDSLDNVIMISTEELEKIKDDYEKINGVDDWDIDQRIRFLTEYFRRKSASKGNN